jgi:sensor histidine kinase regulating citrate/malate metabolism
MNVLSDSSITLLESSIYVINMMATNLICSVSSMDRKRQQVMQKAIQVNYFIKQVQIPLERHHTPTHPLVFTCVREHL